MKQLAFILLAVGALACSDAHSEVPHNTESAGIPPANTQAVNTVDSVFTMPEMIARFQRSLRAPDAGFGTNAATGRRDLMSRLARALEANNARGLDSLRVNAAEFGYLYFPTSQWARVPYNQPPAVQWLLTDQASIQGAHQLLKRFGGKPITNIDYQCRSAPVSEGANQIWSGCSMLITSGAVTERLNDVGSVISYRGRFKFISLANKL